ncbi:MAG: hypothetical protein HZA24_10425 [Nitrospirae bacterium]|nr:hypothetical protein [Nitrospirota bacterium]
MTRRFGTRSRIGGLALAVLVPFCVPSAVPDALAKDKAARTAAYDFAAGPAAQAETYVDLSGAKHFGEITKLAIINYNIEFTAYKEASNSRQSSGWSENTATGIETRTTTTHSQQKSRGLPMLDMAALQAMVDKSYADLTGTLQGMGIEVVSYDTLKAMPEYENFEGSLHASPWVTETKDSNSIFVAPTGMALYMDNLERANALQGLSGMFKNTNYKEMKVIFAHKDMALLSVNMVVDFATVEADKSFLSYQVDADMVHHLQARNSSFRFMGYGQPNWVRADLKQHLVSDRPFWEEVPAEAPAVEQAETKEGMGALVGAWKKIKKASTTEDKTYTFDMDTYYARSTDMMLALQGMFMTQLGGYRK